MQTNIYAAKENGDLRLIAEIEGLDDPALAVDALLDEMPRLKQREFIVINLDDVMTVEAGDEIVQPRRQINVKGGNNKVQTPAKRGRRPRAVEPEPEEEENGEEEVAAPAPAKRSRGRAAAAKGGKKASPFKSNPKSAD
jgi:hypothetical protein